MRLFKINRLSGFLGVAAVVASIGGASAQGVQVGVLDCRGGQNVGFLVGSATTLNCSFRGPGRRPEAYIANIRRFGVDVGFTQQTNISWAVYSQTRQIGRGDLAGGYGGVGANASVGLGFGGNLLAGGSSNAFSLQPLSVQGQTGLNVTAGIADLQLVPARMRSSRRAYRARRSGR